MRVRFDKASKTFICQCSSSERHLPDKNGFMYNPITRQWETKKISKAIRLREFFDESAKDAVNCHSFEETPWPNGLFIPENQRLKDFQIEGVNFALNRNHSYLAFEQGLGKTPTGIAIINAVNLPTLIICPPFLVENWKRELRLWLLNGEPANIVSGKQIDVKKTADVIVLPDSLLDKDLIHDFLRGQDFGVLVVDEAHRFKNSEAVRTKNLFGKIAPLIPKIVLLSGTPIPNRPMELYAPLSNLAHNVIDFLSYPEYGVKFCAGHKKKFGWDYSGSSNADELSRKIHGTFMLRKMKAEVLQELAPKEERVTVMGGVVNPELKKITATIKRKGITPEGMLKVLGEYAKMRTLVGMAKVPLALEFVADILENTNESILLFAWHHEVMAALLTGLKKYKPVEINGKTPMRDRAEAEKEFQNKKSRVLIGQIQCMVGLNLTAATRVVFAEFSWVPADNDQASDRAHRIGQKDSVTVDYLALAKTLDEDILETLLRKKKVINKLVNKRSI